jgi:hypothetical protein
MSSLLRRNPLGYEALTIPANTQWIHQMFRLPSTHNRPLDVCVKTLILLADLAQHEAEVIGSLSSNVTFSLNSDGGLSVMQAILTPQLCGDVLLASFACVASDDSVEKALEALARLKPFCASTLYVENESVGRHAVPSAQLSKLLSSAQVW